MWPLLGLATVFISGVFHTARDKAHDRMLADRHRPFSLKDARIYHSGPLMVKEKNEYRVISTGPITSARMNAQTPATVEQGVTAIIGKGGLSTDVARSFAGPLFLPRVHGRPRDTGARKNRRGLRYLLCRPRRHGSGMETQRFQFRASFGCNRLSKRQHLRNGPCSLARTSTTLDR
jgi:hypothetical protein